MINSSDDSDDDDKDQGETSMVVVVGEKNQDTFEIRRLCKWW